MNHHVREFVVGRLTQRDDDERRTAAFREAGDCRGGI